MIPAMPVAERVVVEMISTELVPARKPVVFYRPLTPLARLDAVETRLEAMRKAIQMVRPPLASKARHSKV
jgi:hypothetical protein